MSGKKQRLELTWIGKEDRPKLEPRILLEDAENSYARPHGEGDIFDNRLIFGDNLLALKALESEFAGKVKCIYIDPPFNTQQALQNYDDGIEHSLWLSIMRDRLLALHTLLDERGTLIHIDDNELAYLIGLTDEIFGRANRRYIITFKQALPRAIKQSTLGALARPTTSLSMRRTPNAGHPIAFSLIVTGTPDIISSSSTAMTTSQGGGSAR